jgi:hypothetical protein
MQGWRKDQEDAHVATPDVGGKSGIAMFGVFDGHGGKAVSNFVQAHIEEELLGQLQKTEDLGVAIESTFHRLDQMLDDESYDKEIKTLQNGGVDPPPAPEPDAGEIIAGDAAGRGRGRRPAAGGGGSRARSHCRFVCRLSFIPDSLT